MALRNITVRKHHVDTVNNLIANFSKLGGNWEKGFVKGIKTVVDKKWKLSLKEVKRMKKIERDL